MRAILITQEGVESVDIEDTIQAYQETLHCDLFEASGQPAPEHVAYVDESGWMTIGPGDQVNLTLWNGSPLAGRILIVGMDPVTGESKDATMEVEDVEEMVVVGAYGPHPLEGEQSWK